MRLTLMSGAALVVATVAAALVGLGLGLGTAPSATFDSLRGGPTSSAGPAGSPLAINGKVRVCGRKLCNQHNRPIQLRGMSTHGLQWFSRCVSDTSLDALVTDWRADVLRISTYVQEGGYVTNPRKSTDLVHTIIGKATARGLYVIVDWHMLTPGDPDVNLTRAKAFFAEIAQAHAGKVNVLYEVANEPNGVTWSRIKDYHQQIIPVIQARDPDAVILLGTRGWSSLGIADRANEKEVVDDPVDASNIMYTFHFYAASHRSRYFDALSSAADQLPIFVSEFGTQRYTGDGPNDFVGSQKYVDLMAAKKISWVNWNYSDDQPSGAALEPGTCPDGTFTGTASLKPAGAWIRSRLRTADDFPTE